MRASRVSRLIYGNSWKWNGKKEIPLKQLIVAALLALNPLTYLKQGCCWVRKGRRPAFGSDGNNTTQTRMLSNGAF
jgi:hypothetical protein